MLESASNNDVLLSISINDLPLARLHLTVRADAALHLPPYAGSMLRGAFGHALLALAPLPHTDGQPCALAHHCPYCQVFATPALPGHSLQKFSNMPQAYVIEPPLGGEQRLRAGQEWGFSLVLIGKALAHLPIVIQAWERALRCGLGVQRSRCTLLAVHAEQQPTPLWQAGPAPAAPWAPAPLPPAAPLDGHATLHLRTPLRLQQRGQIANAGQLGARLLLIALARRWQLLLDVHLGAQAPQQDFARLSAQADALTLTGHQLQWFDWGRYSARQQREMRLGGLLGSVQLKGKLAPFSELLHLGQWLHVGKNATMGMGGYSLTASSVCAASN
ncbi:hypothetical protein C6568_08240 [Melaminivora suipulveris]|uniref:CRISPR-associated protein Cas6 C-terminal domain-containing protein n=1 Tax=Melaminivora suipulveris TaxID=2109913 RepID=A0A2R3QBT8_9BURK|nr:CRISPR system precrRNA processing endoribonuclease RAMP protein Cas6 [Melaminivora suipulveris]AVO49253.1 hypothetical protein C6568_08240 [Melaminivora suipulveris]